MELPKRKGNRLQDYDYSSPGAYFITICTKDRKNLLWRDVGASIARPEDVALSDAGKIVDKAIKNIPVRYPAISVERYVIMPNHVHLLLQIHTNEDADLLRVPSISIVIQQMKGYVTKELGDSVWQKLFHDHVIRNERDYQMIWRYIEGNPMKWTEDCFYIPVLEKD